MPEGASHYPISQFLLRLLDESGLDRDGFIRRLGYRNIARGRRRLDSWLDQGGGYQRILKQIVAAYPDQAARLQSAAGETAKMKDAEAEARFVEWCKSQSATFVPFLHAEGETARPSSITLFGVGGGHRRWTTIEVPKSTMELPLEEQLAILPPLMQEYRTKHNGFCPFFGRLSGFKFVRLLDYFQFDAEGRLLEHVEKPFRYSEFCVELG